MPKTIQLSIKNFRSLGKQIGKLTAQKREREMRNRCIAAAKVARDAVADNAPSSLFTKILQSEKLEREYNKNPGYDVKMEAGAKFTFVLKLSTGRFPKSQYMGYNPVWGMIVSNYGRRAIDVQKPTTIPLPVDNAVSFVGHAVAGVVWQGKGVKNQRYNHPLYGTGYQGRYAGKFVHFTQHVDAVAGTNWMEEGLSNSLPHIRNILTGKEKPAGGIGMNRGARISKSEALL